MPPRIDEPTSRCEGSPQPLLDHVASQAVVWHADAARPRPRRAEAEAPAQRRAHLARIASRTSAPWAPTARLVVGWRGEAIAPDEMYQPCVWQIRGHACERTFLPGEKEPARRRPGLVRGPPSFSARTVCEVPLVAAVKATICCCCCTTALDLHAIRQADMLLRRAGPYILCSAAAGCEPA